MTAYAPPVGPIRGDLWRFTMADEDILALAKLAKPRVLTLADARTPQEVSNDFWHDLGTRMGFDADSVVPYPGSSDPGTFLAVPVLNEFLRRMATAKAAIEPQGYRMLTFELLPDDRGVAVCEKPDGTVARFEQRSAEKIESAPVTNIKSARKRQRRKAQTKKDL